MQAGAVCAMLVCATPAVGQNLFEVQVFPDETLARGEAEVEFHNVLIPAETTGNRLLSSAGHDHLSVEMSYGWTDAFETGVFLETAPDPDDGHPSISGWHVRPKVRFAASSRFPFHVSASVEYAFFKNPGDREFRQALSITPIFERHGHSWDTSLNPGVSVSLKGPAAGTLPVFEPSAKVATRAGQRLSVGVEYYAETGTIRHFEPLSAQHHLVFPALDVHGNSGWDLNVGVGRGLTGGSEHWVLKTILALRVSR